MNELPCKESNKKEEDDPVLLERFILLSIAVGQQSRNDLRTIKGRNGDQVEHRQQKIDEHYIYGYLQKSRRQADHPAKTQQKTEG